MLILETTKGYGIPTMHNKEQHAGKPCNDEEYNDLKSELETFTMDLPSHERQDL